MNAQVRSYELAVVGAMLLSVRAVEEVRLRPEQFFYADTRRAFEAVREVYVQGGTPDLVSVKSLLGGTDAAHEFLLAATESIASASQVGWYVSQMAKAAYVEQVRAWSELPCDTFEDAQAKASAVPVYDSGCELSDIAEVGLPSHLDGVPTGFSCLDRVTHGSGYVCGQTSVASGYQKSGKTSMMTQSCLSVGKLFLSDGSDRLAVYATFADLSPSALLQKMLQQECGSRFVDSGFAQEGLNTVRSLPVRFYDSRKHGRGVEDFCAKVRSLAYKRPVGIVFVDYAQKVGSQDTKLSMVGRMESVSSQLCDLADSLHVPVVLGSQVTISGDGEATTKYARAFEEDAGLVLRIVRKDGEVAFEVPFNRHGPSEKHQAMSWNPRHLTFEEPLAQDARDARFGT